MPQMIMSTAGRFGIKRQTAFDTIQTADADFRYFAFNQCSYGPIEGVASLPLEAGTVRPLPGGTYKTGLFFGGNVNLIPRLDGNIGWLLEAVCGDASSWTSSTIDNVIGGEDGVVGVTTWQFLYYYDNTALGTNWDLPYLTTHKLLPHGTAASEISEVSQDACVSSFQLNVGAGGIVTANVGLVGRGFDYDPDPAHQQYPFTANPGYTDPTLADENTFMVTSCAGSVNISLTGGYVESGATLSTLTGIDVAGLQMTMVNNLLPPARSRIVGTPFHVDHPNLGRFCTITLPNLVSDYHTYMQCFAGAQAVDPPISRNWSCTPVAGDIDFTLQSPAVIGATTTYHQMRFRTTQGNANFTATPVVLVPGQPVVYNLTCTLSRPSSGLPFEWYIQNNGAEDYTAV